MVTQLAVLVNTITLTPTQQQREEDSAIKVVEKSVVKQKMTLTLLRFVGVTGAEGWRNAMGKMSKGQGFRSMAFPLGSSVKGEVAKKTPIKILCEQGKTYTWCACGLSGRQPFCDGSHQKSSLGLTPIQWTSDLTKEYFFCCCKQTNSRPFCDGSHKKL